MIKTSELLVQLLFYFILFLYADRWYWNKDWLVKMSVSDEDEVIFREEKQEEEEDYPADTAAKQHEVRNKVCLDDGFNVDY